MAEDPGNTKPDLCSFDEADWVSATKLGENITQIHHGAWVLARVDIQEALAGGCGAVLELEQNGQKSYWIPPLRFWLPPDRLRWVNGLNPSMRREDYPDRSWPWELRAYLSPNEPWEFRHIEGFPLAREQVSTLRVFLRRAEAVQWGLSPALESPQAVASEEPPPSREQPGESTVGSAGGEAAPAPASVADASVPVVTTEAPVGSAGGEAAPAPASVADASAPAANTEAPVAEPEAASPLPVDAITTEPQQQQQIPRMSSTEQSQWLKTALADNPPRKDEPLTPEGYGKRIAEMGTPLGAMYKPSSVIARYYQLNPGARRRRKPQK